MEMELLEKYETEKNHSAFLEKLLAALYGDGWEKLTLFDARAWHDRHFASKKADSVEAKKPCVIFG